MPDTPDLAWADPALRARLEADPAAVLRDRGISPPPELPLAIVHEFVRVAYLIWVDGKITPVNEFQIDPGDEGLLFGRGAWESTRTVNGVPWLWPLHTDRFRQTAELLGIPLDPARVPDEKAVTAFVRELTGQDVILRLNVSAGRPGHPGVVWMSAAPIPIHPPTIRLRSVRNPVAKGQAYLTLKTFQYATRLRIGRQAAETGYDSALMIDADGNIQEAAHANIFFKLPEGWLTPKADGGFLPGTVRQFIMDRSPIPVRDGVIPLSAVAQAREVFVTNSNAGIVPVSQIDAFTFGVGPDTAQLMKWIEPPRQPGIQYRFVERVGTAR